MTEKQAEIPPLPGRLLNFPRARRLALWAATLFLGFGLFAYLAGPPIAKSILQHTLSGELRRPVSIERIAINPYALSVRLNGLSVQGGDGRELAGLDELFVNFSAFSLFQAGAVADEIRLSGPRLRVTRLAEGRYDVSDLLEAWLKPSEQPIPRFSLNNIQISGGRLEFDDRPVGKLHSVTDIKLTLPFISSLPYQTGIVVEPSFSATVNGAPLVLQGKGKPFAETHESALSLDLDHLDLGRLQAYLPESLPFRLKRGTVDSELQLLFREQGDKLHTLTLAGAVHISHLQTADADGQPLLGWRKFDLSLTGADLLNRRFKVERINLDGLETRIHVNRDGTLNWISLAEKLAGTTPSRARPPEWALGELRLHDGLIHWLDESNPRPVAGKVHRMDVTLRHLESGFTTPIELVEAAYAIDLGDLLTLERVVARRGRINLAKQEIDLAEAAASGMRARLKRDRDGRIEWVSTPVLKTLREVKREYAEENPWHVAIARLEADDLAARFEDFTTEPSAVQVLENFNLKAENLDSRAGSKGTLAVHGKVNGKGTLKLDGQMQLQPLSATLDIETLAIPMLPLQPYFSEYLNIALTRGQISSKGKLALKMGKDGPDGSYTGQLTLGDFHSVDKAGSNDFLKWKSLHLGGMDIRLRPASANIGEIALSEFYSRLIVDPEGRLNLMQILRRPGTPPDTAANTAPFPLRIGKVSLQGGTISFSDYFIKPNYSANMSSVGGHLTGLSSSPDTMANMELRGSYADIAPFLLTARLNPLSAKAFLDLQAEVKGVDLAPFSPYSGKYAGYAIEKGKLSLFVNYKLDKGQLRADNRIFLDQLSFGEKIDSPDATSLPVTLGVALLKNGRGEIDLNLPISGSLDDPEFSLGDVIVKIIVNLFAKAATAPFALLGSMFGNGEELSSIEFEPGRASLSEVSVKRLEALAGALNDRPGLKLEITARIDPENDREGLRRAGLEHAVRAEKLKELVKKGVETGSPDNITLDAVEYPIYLQRAYREARFPKPRNLIGMHKELPPEEMEKLMLAHLPASDEDLRQLAGKRAESVQSWLAQQGKVAQERIFVTPPKLGPDEKDESRARKSRVDFSLH